MSCYTDRKPTHPIFLGVTTSGSDSNHNYTAVLFALATAKRIRLLSGAPASAKVRLKGYRMVRLYIIRYEEKDD